MMKPEKIVSSASTTEGLGDSNSHDKIETTSSSSSSSPKSTFRKLCHKLSPSPSRKSEKSSPLGVGSELQRVFRYFDEDGDGKISPVELQSCLRTVGGELSWEEAEMAVQSSDSDGDGMLGLEDFAKLMEGGAEDELREAFGMYEMEGTGCITPKSLKRMLRRLGESTSIDNCKTMIRKFDLNGDGVLNFDEFRMMMRR
ncbi:unnamed protein product [Ilex paraguariensis]|uniref:EF-hand domain-containing protein n=1 Tax=Ilex paraguariensis TaxID=185542 RepID=A0ABC8UB77_9AQUA